MRDTMLKCLVFVFGLVIFFQKGIFEFATQSYGSIFMAYH